MRGRGGEGGLHATRGEISVVGLGFVWYSERSQSQLFTEETASRCAHVNGPLVGPDNVTASGTNQIIIVRATCHPHLRGLLEQRRGAHVRVFVDVAEELRGEVGRGG